MRKKIHTTIQKYKEFIFFKNDPNDLKKPIKEISLE
jgi:hypothetical protein